MIAVPTHRVSWRPLSPFGPLTASSVFGALAWAWNDLLGPRELERLLGSFAGGEPAFRISEPAPFAGDETEIHFIPAPLLPAPDLSRYAHEEALALSTHRRSLRLGDVRWMSEALFALVAQGNLMPHRLLERTVFAGPRTQEISDSLYVVYREYWMTRDEFFRLPEDAAGARTLPWVEVGQPRLDGRPGGGRRDFRTRGWVAPSSGVQFYLRATQDAVEPLLAALAYLGRTGIGRGKSVGWGRFEDAAIEPVAAPAAGAGAAHATLARTIPTTDEARALAASDRSSYSLVRYEGRLAGEPAGADAAKATVWFVEAGSILEHPLEGRCPVVRRVEDRDVIQYGLALGWPVAASLVGPAAVAS